MNQRAQKGQPPSQGYITNLLENTLWLHLEQRQAGAPGECGALDRLHLLLTCHGGLSAASEPLEKAFLHCSCSTKSSRGHLLYLPIQENTSQALSLAEGVTNQKRAASPRSQSLKSLLRYLEVWDDLEPEHFLIFFFNGKFIGVMYTHSQAHTFIIIAEKAERVRKKTFFLH